MKVGDLVMPKPGKNGGAVRVGLVIGESFSSYNGALLHVVWPDKAHPMWEPKKYLESASENR